MAKQTKSEVSASGDEAPDGAALARTHLKLGWWMVLIYLSLGIGLEALHGLKVDWYLNVANETRRLMFSGLLLPGGFLLGGLVVHGGDPGKGILLVPVGAALLLFAVLQTALRATKK
jgi:predicted sugar kinase